MEQNMRRSSERCLHDPETPHIWHSASFSDEFLLSLNARQNTFLVCWSCDDTVKEIKDAFRGFSSVFFAQKIKFFSRCGFFLFKKRWFCCCGFWMRHEKMKYHKRGFANSQRRCFVCETFEIQSGTFIYSRACFKSLNRRKYLLRGVNFKF
jgi:hypothetical protein